MKITPTICDKAHKMTTLSRFKIKEWGPNTVYNNDINKVGLIFQYLKCTKQIKCQHHFCYTNPTINYNV